MQSPKRSKFIEKNFTTPRRTDMQVCRRQVVYAAECGSGCHLYSGTRSANVESTGWGCVHAIGYFSHKFGKSNGGNAGFAMPDTSGMLRLHPQVTPYLAALPLIEKIEWIVAFPFVKRPP